jgi:hypothetical protein
MLVSCLAYSSTLKMETICSSETSQKVEPFVTTVIRTSNATNYVLYIFTNNGRTMTMTNDRPDLSSEGAPDIDKTILVNVNRNKYPVVRPTWALKPGLTD